LPAVCFKFSSPEEYCALSWDRPFDQPAPLPKGAPARTLQEAAAIIRKLPKVDQDLAEWQATLDLLSDATENRGPMMFDGYP
jgi:hypothetical protein